MNPYKVLGVSPTATQDEIRSAYRKIAKKFHPDLNPGNKEAEKKFKELNTANEILSDPEKRAKFDSGEIDEFGAPKFQQPPPGNEGRGFRGGPYYYETQNPGGRYSTSFEGIDPHLFEELFGGRAAGTHSSKGFDEQYAMEISLKDAALGVEKEITLPTGKLFKVKIPAGIESGKKLRFKGAAQSHGSTPGDIYIEVQVRPSKRFTRNQNNLELELPITLQEAILGGEVNVPTLEGPVKLKIPAGSNTGSKLRLRGKGVGGKAPGDLIVSLKIMLPPNIDPELQKAIKDWGGNHSYNPRSNLESDGEL